MPVSYAFRPLLACGTALALSICTATASFAAETDVVATVDGAKLAVAVQIESANAAPQASRGRKA